MDEQKARSSVNADSLLRRIIAAVLALFVMLAVLFDLSETTVRSFGGVLELIGLITVVVGIVRLYNTFSARPISLRDIRNEWWEKMKRFFTRLLRRGRSVEGAANLEVHGSVMATGSAEGALSVHHRTVEQRIGQLESDVATLQDEARQLRAGLGEAIEGEQAKREAEMNLMREEVRSLALGDLQLQCWGIVSFVLGVILQVWSPEWARL